MYDIDCLLYIKGLYNYKKRPNNMSKKVIINESTLKLILAKEVLSEANLTKNDVASIVKDNIKNNKDVKKEIEKQVKDLVAKSVNTLFKTLWQRRNFYEDEIKR